MSDRRGYLRDAALELLSSSAVSSTQTGSEVTFAASSLKTAKLVVASGGYSSYTAGSAEWTVSLQAATAAGGTFVTIESITLPATAKTIELPFSGPEVTERLGGRAAVVKGVLTKTGSPGAATAVLYISY
jgi:predicted flavoprotein YhiN